MKPKPRKRWLPQEERDCLFTRRNLIDLGTISINIGRLHWQTEDFGGDGPMLEILLKEQERLNDVVASVLLGLLNEQED